MVPSVSQSVLFNKHLLSIFYRKWDDTLFESSRCLQSSIGVDVQTETWGIVSIKCTLYTHSSWWQRTRNIYIEKGHQGSLPSVGNTWLEQGSTHKHELARKWSRGGCPCDVRCIGWMSSCLSGHINFTSLKKKNNNFTSLAPLLLPTPTITDLQDSILRPQSFALFFLSDFTHTYLFPGWASNNFLSGDPASWNMSLFTQQVGLPLMIHAENGIHPLHLWGPRLPWLVVPSVL